DYFWSSCLHRNFTHLPLFLNYLALGSKRPELKGFLLLDFGSSGAKFSVWEFRGLCFWSC
ncbi:hypothetical protein FRX31_003157, partial [Thalictrum thalictroides]